MTFAEALRLDTLGLCLIPLQPRDKRPDWEVLPRDEKGEAIWKPFQTDRPTRAELQLWFGNGRRRNVGISLGMVSGVVVIETDSEEAEAWAHANLPATPMMTRSARGTHRYYRLPTGANAHADIPPTIIVGNGITIEIKRGGQYVVGPGSIHPTGHLYTEVEPWPTSLTAVPEFPMEAILAVVGTPSKHSAQLPQDVAEGSRNNTLFREGCRLRRLGWSETEIRASLLVLNSERCHPPMDTRAVEDMAQRCAKYEPETDTLPATEAGDAEYFAACNADVVRFDHRRARWLVFKDHFWAPQTDGAIHRLALDVVRARQAAALSITDTARRSQRQKWAIGGESRKRQSNLLALAQSIKPLADDGENWDTDPWLLGVANGVVDLRTSRLRDGAPEDRVTMRTRAPFDRDARCPLWEQTLGQIFGDQHDLIDYVGRFVGYSLTGDCREEVLPLCYGGGGNGKGTLINTIGWLLADYADDLPFSSLELHDRSGIPNDIAKLAGKRFVTSSEGGEAKRLNEARIKALTGRDPLTGRFLHQEFFTFQPVAKFWLSTNHKPIVRDTSVGFWRRIHLIPFTRSFADRPDLKLKDKLRAEAAGILAWAVRGCLAWQRDGLNPPAVVCQATKTYQADSMPLGRFLTERCVVEEGKRATFGELFRAYLRWCGEARESSRLTRRELSDALHEQFKTDPSNTQRVEFIGVGLLDLFSEEKNIEE